MRFAVSLRWCVPLVWLAGCTNPTLDDVEKGSRTPTTAAGDHDAVWLSRQVVIPAPTLSPAPGAYFQAPPLNVDVSTVGSPGGQVFYSLDRNVAPTVPYEGRIALETSGYVAAVVKVNGVASAPAQAEYWLRSQLLYSVDAGDLDPGSNDADHELGLNHLGGAEDRAYFSQGTTTPIPDPQTGKLWGYEDGSTPVQDPTATDPPESPGETYRRGSSQLRQTRGGKVRGSYVAYRFQVEDDLTHGGRHYQGVVGLRYSLADLDTAPLLVWLAPDGDGIAADTAKPVGRMRIRSGELVETSFGFSSDDLFFEPAKSAWVVRVAIECQTPGPDATEQFLSAPIGWLRIYSLY